MSIHWTIAQACVWIRTRNQYQVDNLEPRAARSLVLADTVVPGASLARHCLRAALDLGRFAAQGRTAQLDMATASGELQNWILDDEAQAIPREFWEGADFLLGLEVDGAGKGKLGECGRFARVEFDRDRIVAHWPAPRSVLEDGPVPLSHLIDCGALHAGTEDNWGWFFGRGDVTVTGLNAAGQRETIDSQRLAMAPLEIEGNTLTQGAVSWSFVVVSLTPPILLSVTQAPPPPPKVRGMFLMPAQPAPAAALSLPADNGETKSADPPPPLLDQAALNAWMRERFTTWPDDKVPPTRTEDATAARADFTAKGYKIPPQQLPAMIAVTRKAEAEPWTRTVGNGRKMGTPKAQQAT